MELYNRRLLLLDEDVPISTTPMTMPPLPHTHVTATNSSSPPTSASSTLTRPLQVPLRPIFTSSVAYTFLVLFTALFFLAFLLLSLREFSFRIRRRHPPCRGADLAAVKSLPVCSFRGDPKQQPECAICLEEFRECDAVKMIPYCGHVFHPECIDTWLAAHVTCPICRCPIAKLCGGIADEHAGGSTAESRGEGREVGSE